MSRQHVGPTAQERKCVICERLSADGTYCRYHNLAREGLQKRFEDWNRAYGKIDWEMYLERILGLEETGDWVRQVARRELSIISSKTKA